MVAPTDTPVTGDIWHLTVDDLLAPLPEKARLGGAGPFVINLSTSSAPISLPEKGTVGYPHAHVYQIQRTEDRRPRYRLRLGPFPNEDEADAILKKVRDIYPGALTATADADDLRAIGLQPALPAKPAVSAMPAAPARPTVSVTPAVSAEPKVSAMPMAPAKSTVSATPTVSAKPTISETPAAPVKPTVSAMPMAPVTPTVSATPAVPAKPTFSEAPAASTKSAVSATPTAPAKPAVSAAPTAPAKPAVSAAPIAPAKPAVSAAPIAPAKPAVSAAPTAPAKPAVSAAPTAPTKPIVSATPTAPTKPIVSATPAGPAKPTMSAMPAAEQPDKPLPSLESTQTVRVLTQLELEDDEASRWFVIQLAQAQEAFDPNTVPNLDIFRVYRLYSVAGIDQGRIVHSLRLGFFSEEIAAAAVASYLAAFYEKPSVKRVSSAERERFAQQSLEPRKDVGASGEHAVIEITNERFVRERRGGQTAAK